MFLDGQAMRGRGNDDRRLSRHQSLAEEPGNGGEEAFFATVELDGVVME